MKHSKFRKFLSGVFYTIGDAFDSAKVSPRRGTPPGAYPTDAKNELPTYTRNELVRRARYLEKNSGHIRGTLRDMKGLRYWRRDSPQRQNRKFGMEPQCRRVFPCLEQTLRHHEPLFI